MSEKSTLMSVKSTLKLVKSTLKLEKSTLMSIKSTLKLVKSTLMSVKSTLKLILPTLKLILSTLKFIFPTLKFIFPTLKFIFPTLKLAKRKEKNHKVAPGSFRTKWTLKVILFRAHWHGNWTRGERCIMHFSDDGMCANGSAPERMYVCMNRGMSPLCVSKESRYMRIFRHRHVYFGYPKSSWTVPRRSPVVLGV